MGERNNRRSLIAFASLGRIATALSILSLVAFTLVCFSSTCLRYVWATRSPGMGAGIWIGDGGFGYIGYLAILEQGETPKNFHNPVGFSWGPSFDDIGPWPTHEMDIFGVEVRTVPIWPVVVVGPSVLLGVFVVRMFRRRARLSKGGCLSCGYNLTGNASGVCPECGTPTSA